MTNKIGEDFIKKQSQLSKSNRAIIHAFERGYRSDAEGKIYGPSGDELSLGKGTNGYLIFRIWMEEEHVSVPAHRFSAYCYFGDRLFENECVRHLNGDKTDNRRSNIAIGSLSDNYKDIPPQWRMDFALKGASTKRKLTSDDVREIRKLLDKGESYSRISERFGVAKTTIQQIKEGRTYKWVK